MHTSRGIVPRVVTLGASWLTWTWISAVPAHALAPPTPLPPPPPPLPMHGQAERWLSMHTLHDFYYEVSLFFNVVGEMAWVGVLLAAIVLMGAATAWLRADTVRRQRVP